jgi:hypothetical protein
MGKYRSGNDAAVRHNNAQQVLVLVGDDPLQAMTHRNAQPKCNFFDRAGRQRGTTTAFGVRPSNDVCDLKASFHQTLKNHCCCRRSAKENERTNLCSHDYFNPI